MRRIALVVVGVALCAALMAAAWNRGMCAYTGWQLDRDTRYAAFVGCVVRTADGWLPLKQVRDIE